MTATVTTTECTRTDKEDRKRREETDDIVGSASGIKRLRENRDTEEDCSSNQKSVDNGGYHWNINYTAPRPKPSSQSCTLPSGTTTKNTPT